MGALRFQYEGPFIVGGNYWPADRGFFWWENFTKATVAGDFSRLQETGWEVVRVLLSWEIFSPRQIGFRPVLWTGLCSWRTWPKGIRCACFRVFWPAMREA